MPRAAERALLLGAPVGIVAAECAVANQQRADALDQLAHDRLMITMPVSKSDTGFGTGGDAGGGTKNGE
jgi:hypothetical protein